MQEQEKFQSPVTIELDREKVPYRAYTHPGPVHSLEQAASERGQKPEQVIRSILFHLPDDQFLMVLASGPDQISWKALRKTLGISRMTMASDEDLETVTGYLPGAVSPFGLRRPVRILVDDRISQLDEISIGSGVRGTTIIMSSKALMQALGSVEVIPLVKS